MDMIVEWSDTIASAFRPVDRQGVNNLTHSFLGDGGC